MDRVVRAKRRISPEGARLRALRDGGGLSQSEVAEGMQGRGFPLTQSFLCRIECGTRKVSPELIQEIAAVIVAITEERYRAVRELTQ